MYYRGANAALLLYDITNASSFEDVRGWLEGAQRPQPSLARAGRPPSLSLAVPLTPRWPSCVIDN